MKLGRLGFNSLVESCLRLSNSVHISTAWRSAICVEWRIKYETYYRYPVVIKIGTAAKNSLQLKSAKRFL